MKIYLDTADYNEWPMPEGCPPIQGVTTNPTLVKQAGLPVNLDTYLDLVRRAGNARLPELMLQLPGADPNDACRWLEQLRPAAEQAQVALTVKLPCHPGWSAAISEMRNQGAPFLLTGVSNPVQLLWAKAQGASYVAPYLGRLQADGREIDAFIAACVALQHGGPKLLAASIRSAEVFCRLIAAGAYAATVRPAFLKESITDPLTEAAIADFDADTQASLALAG